MEGGEEVPNQHRQIGGGSTCKEPLGRRRLESRVLGLVVQVLRRGCPRGPRPPLGRHARLGCHIQVAVFIPWPCQPDLTIHAHVSN